MATPLSSTDPSDLANAARCFSSCVPVGLHMAMRTQQINNVAVVVTNPVCTAPSAPTNVGPLNQSNTTIKMSWKQVTNHGSFITGYIVYWGTTSGGPYTNNSGVVGIVPKNYTITGLNPGTTYYFIVVAQTAVGGCVSANSAQGSATTSGAMCTLSAKVLDWLARITANNTAAGAIGTPAMTTQCAVEHLYEGLVADGIDGKIIAMLPYIPDVATTEGVGASVLAMMRTPLYVGGGADPWQNQSFVVADLTANGLIGDALTKYLVTLLNPTLMAWTPASDCGMSVYVMDGSSNAGWGEMGVNKPSNSSVNVVLFANLSGTSYGELVGFPAGTPSGVAPNKAGFYGVSRTGINAATLYFGNSTTPFAALGATAGASGVPPNRGMLVHALANDDAGGINNFTSGRRISFACWHTGLSLAQHQALFNRVQAYRVELGGGFA